MTIYHVPILGYIVALVEYNRECKRYWAAEDHTIGSEASERQWKSFENTNTAFISTVIGMAALALMTLVIHALFR